MFCFPPLEYELQKERYSGQFYPVTYLTCLEQCTHNVAAQNCLLNKPVQPIRWRSLGVWKYSAYIWVWTGAMYFLPCFCVSPLNSVFSVLAHSEVKPKSPSKGPMGTPWPAGDSASSKSEELCGRRTHRREKRSCWPHENWPALSVCICEMTELSLRSLGG